MRQDRVSAAMHGCRLLSGSDKRIETRIQTEKADFFTGVSAGKESAFGLHDGKFSYGIRCVFCVREAV